MGNNSKERYDSYVSNVADEREIGDISHAHSLPPRRGVYDWILSLINRCKKGRGIANGTSSIAVGVIGEGGLRAFKPIPVSVFETAPNPRRPRPPRILLDTDEPPPTLLRRKWDHPVPQNGSRTICSSRVTRGTRKSRARLTGLTVGCEKLVTPSCPARLWRRYPGGARVAGRA